MHFGPPLHFSFSFLLELPSLLAPGKERQATTPLARKSSSFSSLSTSLNLTTFLLLLPSLFLFSSSSPSLLLFWSLPACHRCSQQASVCLCVWLPSSVHLVWSPAAPFFLVRSASSPSPSIVVSSVSVAELGGPCCCCCYSSWSTSSILSQQTVFLAINTTWSPLRQLHRPAEDSSKQSFSPATFLFCWQWGAGLSELHSDFQSSKAWASFFKFASKVIMINYLKNLFDFEWFMVLKSWLNVEFLLIIELKL